MDIKKRKKNSKFKTYQIPDKILKKNFLEIKNQLNAKLNFLKTNTKRNLNSKKLNFEDIPIPIASSTLNKKGEIIENQKNISLQNSYSTNNKQIPILLKNVIKSKDSNIKDSSNNDKLNSVKNNSNELINSLSLNLINLIKHKNKRPLSSYSNIKNENRNKYSSINKKIYKSLIDEKKINFMEYKNISLNKNKEIKKPKNRPMSSNLISPKHNILSKSKKNNNEAKNNHEDIIIDKIKYKIKLKNKSEIWGLDGNSLGGGGENLRYKKNNIIFKENKKQNKIPFFDKLNNNNFNPRINRINFSKIRENKLKYYSVDNQSKSNSNYIRDYFLYKDGKTKSLDNIFDNKNIKENNNLIYYKNVFYSNKKRNINNILDKIKMYNDAIRARNEQIKKDKKLNLNSEKKYSFYKYKEYMNEIEKEELDNYKKEKEKKDLINIQEIFYDTTLSRNKTRKNSLIVKNQNQTPIQNQIQKQINLSKNYSNEDLKNINIIYTPEIIKEEQHNSSKNLIKTGKISKKSSLKSLKRKKNISKKRKKIEKDESSSYSQSDIIINNYDSNKKNKNKKNENTNMANIDYIPNLEKKRNSFKNLINEQKKLFDQEIDTKINRKMTDPENAPEDPKEKNNPEILENEINNTEFNIYNYMSMKNKQRTKNSKIFDILKENYLRNRKELMMKNKLNLKAQKLLFEKIKEAEKNQQAKRSSQFIPFMNLKFRHLEDEIKKHKEEMLLNKYYKKNSFKKYNVRLKHKNSISVYNSNSLNSSINDIIEQYNEFRYKNNFDFKAEDENIIDNNDNISKKDYNNESNNVILISHNEEENSINDLNELFFNKDDNNISKKEDKEDKIIEENENLRNFEDDKITDFMRMFLEKYEKNKIKENNEIIEEEAYENIDNQFLNIIRENDEIIKASEKKEEIELFLEFKEKMNSLEKLSKKEFNLYIYRNYKTILNILEECKRDKQKEYQINEFLKVLNYNLNMFFYYKKHISNRMKIVNYQPFFSYFKKSV